ncbi:hypothetical protein DRH27_02035 [Candidatus Falkowbacteria bacterium]|nr:MAG: hypothetical protein DRH27_02035 [Candidatus Falkowbacteria bacterium]
MYLEKLEIQGFKSFASKNILVFPGMLDKSRRGITSIVGPNGSGKSNVADAVRWALGEQSMKTLRGKKAEDIIFSGSDKKGKLGMAEVSLFLNNESRQAPIDYSQVVITRRLFRSGDSEYMLNNNRVRLSDIQMMLAKAKFGQKTYSVIGQGMVEGFLNTSLSERKEFFDEATGVKQYQIKRDDSLNKLRGSYENLIQAQMLLSEIEPRLKSLTRQVNRLKKRDEIEKELKKLQLNHYSGAWHSINNNFKQFNNKFLEQEKIKIDKDRKLDQLNRKLEELKIEDSQKNEYFILQEKLNRAQAEKEEASKKFAKIEAQIEMKLEANGQIDLSFLLNKKEEIIAEISSIQEEASTLEKNIGYAEEKGAEIKTEKEAVDKKIEALNKKREALNNETETAKIVKNRLNKILDKLRIIAEEASIERIKEMAHSIKKEIKALVAESEQGGKKDSERKELSIQEELNELFSEKDVLNIKMNENNLRISARSERVKLLREKIDGLKREVELIGEKLKQKSNEFNYEEISDRQNKLKQELNRAQANIQEIKDKISRARENEEKSRNKLFSLQNESQTLQKEINEANYELNELKVNSTRYETKLENLEIEIREEYGNLKEIKDKKIEAEEENGGAEKEKIRQLKRQLELIGGIDPEVEREYNSTKERYDFLSGQVNDFISAVDSLKKIIKELDLTIKERFDKEFKIIAGNFEKYFKILFNGGHAKIIKVMEDMKESASDKKSESEEVSEDNPSTSSEQGNKSQEELSVADLKKIKFLQKHNATGLAGIEIKATPPGKKISSVAMLSGGERALTAIALICAIIYSNPSPFVVLDEVDAALDEANSERLAKILDELSHKTQFILITHNRASMRRANVLYGVTMGDDGVSKLLSVKLEEADKVVRS